MKRQLEFGNSFTFLRVLKKIWFKHKLPTLNVCAYPTWLYYVCISMLTYILKVLNKKV